MLRKMPTRFTPPPGGIAAVRPLRPLWTKEGSALERWGARAPAAPEDWSPCTQPASQTPPWPPAPPCAAPCVMSGWRTPTLCSAPPSLLTSSASLAPDKASNSRELVERSIVPVGRNALWWAPMSPGPLCRGRLQPSLLEMWKWKRRETRDFSSFRKTQWLPLSKTAWIVYISLYIYIYPRQGKCRLHKHGCIILIFFLNTLCFYIFWRQKVCT